MHLFNINTCKYEKPKCNFNYNYVNTNTTEFLKDCTKDTAHLKWNHIFIFIHFISLQERFFFVFVFLNSSALNILQCFFFSFFFFFFFWLFRDRVSLYSPGCPGTHSVEQAGLELRNPPASASQVLGSKACATTTRLSSVF